jgi:SAM-dependent methyltransferase
MTIVMESHQYDLMYQLEDTHWWFKAKRQFIQTVLPPPDGHLKILDLGAGTGGLSKYLQNWGRVLCIEKSPLALKYLKKRGLDYKNQDLNTWMPPKNYYDLITICDVLYHQNIKDDQEIIKKAYSALKTNGLFIVTDSAIPKLSSHYDRMMHARKRYLLNEMINMTLTVRFSILKASYIYFFVFPFFVLSRLVDKIIPVSNVNQPSDFINRILFGICYWESKIYKYVNFPAGSSVMVVARKI